jgi:hypothetical protein
LSREVTSIDYYFDKPLAEIMLLDKQLVLVAAMVMVAAMVTAAQPSGCGGAFFQCITSAGKPIDCTGLSKPLADVFIKADFPAPFFDRMRQQFAVYYKGSGELFHFDFEQGLGPIADQKVDRSALTDMSDAVTPEFVFGSKHRICLIKLTSGKGAAFQLEKQRWHRQLSVAGVFKKGIALERAAVFLTERGQAVVAPF